MGNRACCSGSDSNGKWCRSANGAEDISTVEPPKDEVLGVALSPPPGVAMKDSITPNGEKDASSGDQLADNRQAVSGNDTGQVSTVAYEDGSKYTGTLQDGLRHGHGVRECSTGSYDGQWEADQQHGRGKQIWNDGRTYEGTFKLGKFDGSGKMVWHTQKGMLVYEGEYKDDLKHGSGKFSWEDGRCYDGEWQRGMRHGRGKYTNASSQQKVGYWVDDKFDRWEATNHEGPSSR